MKCWGEGRGGRWRERKGKNEGGERGGGGEGVERGRERKRRNEGGTNGIEEDGISK